MSEQDQDRLLREIAQTWPREYVIHVPFSGTDAALQVYLDMHPLGLEVQREQLTTGSVRYLLYREQTHYGALQARDVGVGLTHIAILIDPFVQALPSQAQEQVTGFLVAQLSNFANWLYVEQRNMEKLASIYKNQAEESLIPTAETGAITPIPVEDPTDQRILEWVTEDPDLTDAEIGQRLNINRQAVNTRRKRLEAMGYKVR